MSAIEILRQLACRGQPAYSCSIMHRVLSVGLLALLTATISSQSKPDWQTRRESCVATPSSFAVDPAVTKPPALADDLDGVKIEYVSSGCYGKCPAFTLWLEKGKATWEGHAFVRKKGKAAKQISARVCGAIASMAGRQDVCDAR